MTKRKPPEELLPLMSVRVRGVVYPTAEACAKAFGIKAASVRHLVWKNRADSIGLGSGTTPRRRVPPVPAQPITIGRWSFPSQLALCEYIGVNRGYYNRMKSVGRLDNVLRKLMAVTAAKEAEALKGRNSVMNQGVSRNSWNPR